MRIWFVCVRQPMSRPTPIVMMTRMMDMMAMEEDMMAMVEDMMAMVEDVMEVEDMMAMEDMMEAVGYMVEMDLELNLGRM